MTFTTTSTLESSARRLFPNQSLDHILAELLLERAQKNLIKYQTTARQFHEKYHQEFDTFRQEVLKAPPKFEGAQDYFDWELAVTGIKDIEEEIKRLRKLI
jgi:hypothetical protein